MGIELVILDWAGTTVDYGCYAPAVAFIKAFKKCGIDITMEEARAPMGLKKDVHIQKILEMEEVKARWVDKHNSVPDEISAITIFREFLPLQIECLRTYADLIPGTINAVKEIREQFGAKIGSTTGYMGNDSNPGFDMVKLLLRESEKRGYIPDFSVCATGHTAVWNGRDFDYGRIPLPEARPAPWMCLENAKLANTYNFKQCVKVDDTVAGVQEGLNAGMWTIGLSRTGTYVGKNALEIAGLGLSQLAEEIGRADEKLRKGGAHFVVEGIWDIPKTLRTINILVSEGQTPYNYHIGQK